MADAEILDDEGAARDWLARAFAPSAEQWARLERFATMLVAENEQQNLIAASTIPILWVRHIADSAQLLALDAGGEGLWIDLGSGPGLPGLVVAILSERPMLLVESRKRRIEWLEAAKAALGLDRCEVIGARLETVESFAAGVISARAFAPMPKLIELAERFSTKQTLWLLPKGRSAEQDLAGLTKNRRAMFHVEQSLTDAEAGIIIGGPIQGGRPEARQAS